MIVLGLTGSIGMGKSTTAQMFRDAGIRVYDADAVVHELYAGKAALLVENAFPGSTVDGKVDRSRLSTYVVGKPAAMKKLEAIIHPLVHEQQLLFLDNARSDGESLVVLDIPLLYEGGHEKTVDAVVVVTASIGQQRQRVLARPGMTSEKFEAILSQQVPDEKKRELADFVIDTGKGMENARKQVLDIIKRAGLPDFQPD